jgi:hypothetical protein
MMGLAPSAIVFFVLSALCMAVSGYFTLREIEEINRKLPQGEQVEYAWMYPGKMQRIRHAYKRLYPEGTIDQWRIVFAGSGIVFIALTAVAAGFLG